MTQILYEKVREDYVRDCLKHHLEKNAEEFATNKINALTNDQLLKAISDALEDICKS